VEETIRTAAAVDPDLIVMDVRGSGFGHNRDPTLRLEQGTDAVADQLVIIDQHHAQTLGGFICSSLTQTAPA
jgi:hypothetical protein